MDTMDEVTKLIQIISDMSEQELTTANEIVDEIIKYKYKDEDSISQVFDRMLSIEFIDMDELKKPYYKLLKYVRKIDKDLADDYEKFFIEKFTDDEEDDFDMQCI